ncbi:CPBP family intramembrane glutamic endopeptidase [Rhodococcus qingshengii]|uniref:CPBP family intramembrane glutamic endopeptidase n=1 Tax=Rhodococcus qingshengii TaxID=334542 RepID=UPI001F32B6F0|nr:CPBP family intramembrane glutamic endopeptidase [Rhodococcus qingshengii]
MSWQATIAVIAVIWTVLYANATVGAIGQLIESRVSPDDTSTTWAAVLSVTRLIVSAVLAVAILVVVKNWRNLTWTQLGIPYQRWLHGRWERTELVKSRRRTTRSAFVGFFVAVGAAASISLIVGGMDADQNIGSGNLFVAVIHCIRAGIFEEIGMIAIPATLVLYRTQIDRPAGNKWPIAALVIGSGIARAVPHIYYGPGALVWAFTWGAIVMIVFLRTRRILPIIAAHITWDLCVTAILQL